MRELNFGLKPENGPAQEDNNEKIIEEARGELNSLAKDILKYSPEDKEFSELKEAFIKIQPVVKKEIQQYVENQENSDFHFVPDQEYSLYFNLLNKLNLFSGSDKELAARFFMVSDGLDSVIAEDIIRKKQIYNSKEKDINQEDYLAGYILKKFDFSDDETADLIKSWLSIKKDAAAEWSMSQNLKNIRNLENFEHDSPKYLYDNFGIRCFGRYDMKELKKQYREKDDTGPYGLFFRGVADWNGSFSESDESKDIRDKVEENSFLLRIIEATGKIDLAKRLLYLRDKYNQKIKFMYMNAHGNTDVVGFGYEGGDNRTLDQKDLKGKGVQRIKELFDDKAELVLSSCLTGTKGGLAEEMANTYNVKVIASDKATEGDPKFIDIKKNSTGDNLEFNIEFSTSDDDDTDKIKKGTVIYRPDLDK